MLVSKSLDCFTLVLTLNIKEKKCNEIVGLPSRLPVCLSKKALFTIYKSFIRPHLNYGNIFCDKTDNQN